MKDLSRYPITVEASAPPAQLPPPYNPLLVRYNCDLNLTREIDSYLSFIVQALIRQIEKPQPPSIFNPNVLVSVCKQKTVDNEPDLVKAQVSRFNEFFNLVADKFKSDDTNMALISDDVSLEVSTQYNEIQKHPITGKKYKPKYILVKAELALCRNEPELKQQTRVNKCIIQ